MKQCASLYIYKRLTDQYVCAGAYIHAYFLKILVWK